jgi:hypothetical protein
VGLDGRRPSKFILSRMEYLLLWWPGEFVRTLHASFADYLTDPDRCQNCPWIIVPSEVHHTLDRGCIRLLQAGPRFNIRNLKRPTSATKTFPGWIYASTLRFLLILYMRVNFGVIIFNTQIGAMLYWTRSRLLYTVNLCIGSKRSA